MQFRYYMYSVCTFIWILCFLERECCRFGPGTNCGFPCRCTGENICNADTGTCLDGSQCQSVPPDGYGWEGPGCRIGNVAYGKTDVHQSGMGSYYRADLAVDGNTTPYITTQPGESCAQPLTYSETYAWWWVDLEDIFTIQSVTIVNRQTKPGFSTSNRYIERSTGYDIKIGNTSDRSQQALCFHQDKPWDTVQPIETMTCDAGDMVGRYVRFERTGGRDPNEAAICEFIVVGYKTIECDPGDCIGVCDSVIGCDRCAAGKMLPDCIDECQDSYWGESCVTQCGKCKDDVVCDKVTGSCGEQCEGWYIPQLCTQQLRLPPAIISVRVSDITSDAAILSWDISTGLHVAISKYFYYIVQHKRKNDNTDDWNTSYRIPLSNETSFEHKLSGLEHNIEYDVQIEPYREINGQTDRGRIETTQLKTLCIVPDTPSTPSIHGTLDMFTVTWDPITSIVPGCDSLQSVAVKVTCENSTHTILNQTYDILMANKAFTYETLNAISCSAMLFVTNNEYFSSASAITSITQSTTKTTTETLFTTNETEVTQQHIKESGPNITAIVIGAVACVVVTILVVVIVLLALRKRSNMQSPSGNKPDRDIAGYGNSNPVYENTIHGNDNMQTSRPAVHSSTEVTHTADNKVPDELYENTKEPESQYQPLDDTGGNTSKPSTVYQELR